MSTNRTQSATRKIAYNTAVQIVGKGVMTVIAAVSVGVLTRYLGPTGYGKFTIALVFLSFFSILADLGLFTIVVKKISEDESRTERIVGNAMSLRAVLSIGVMLLAIGIGMLLPYTPDVKVGIAIASTSLIFGLLNSSLITIFQARLRMDYSVISDVVGRAASLVAVLVVASLDLGYYAVVATATVGALGTFLVSWYFARRFVRVRFLGDRQLWKSLFWEALPYGLTIALVFIYFRLDTFLLSLFRSNAEVGFYGAAFKIIEILLTIPGFFVNSVFPVLTRYLYTKDKRVAPLAQQSFDVLVLLSLPVAAGAILLGEPIIRLVAGAEFAEAGLALQLLAPALVFSFINLLFGNMIVAQGRFKTMLWLSASILVTNVVLNVATIPTYGFRAAAINTVISEALLLVASGLLVRSFYKFVPKPTILPRALVAIALMSGVILLLGSTHWVLAGTAGVAAYAVGIYAFNGPGREILDLVRNKNINA